MRHRCRTILTRSARLLVLVFLSLPSIALADSEAWAPALTDQIFGEHQCVVAFLSQVVEREIDGRDVVIAKVHCEDDRAFDVYRASSFSRFEITECERPNHETC